MNLFCDVDGTFWQHSDRNLEQYRKNVAAAKRWRAAGHSFGLATGRGIPSLRRNFPDFEEYSDYLITDNGSFVTDVKTGKVINEIVFESRQIAQILSFVRSKYSETEAKVAYQGYSQEYQLPIVAIGKIRVWLRTPELANKLYFELSVHFAANGYKFHAERNALPSSLDWVTPDYKSFVNIVPADSGKECALAALKKMRKLTGEVVVIGDDLNDLAMIEKYNGFVMTNAHPLMLEKIPKNKRVKNPEELINLLLKQKTSL